MSRLLLEKPLDYFEESEKGYGRHSEWSVSVHNAPQSRKAQEWCCLRRLIHVHKTVSDTKTGEVPHSDRLYISDLLTTSAAYYAKVIKGHWGIENNLHRIKDVLHGEDDNGVAAGNAAINIST